MPSDKNNPLISFPFPTPANLKPFSASNSHSVHALVTLLSIVEELYRMLWSLTLLDGIIQYIKTGARNSGTKWPSGLVTGAVQSSFWHGFNPGLLDSLIL